MILLPFRSVAFAALLAALAPGAASAAAAGITFLGSPPSAVAAPGAAPARAPRIKPPTVIIDNDSAGREPFEVSVSLSIASPVVSIPIPAGYRLILEEVNMVGTAIGSAGPIQPFIVTLPSTAANAQVPAYLAPAQSATVAGEFVGDYAVRQYADALSVAAAYVGSMPSYFGFTVMVSGHLISIAP